MEYADAAEKRHALLQKVRALSEKLTEIDAQKRGRSVSDAMQGFWSDIRTAATAWVLLVTLRKIVCACGQARRKTVSSDVRKILAIESHSHGPFPLWICLLFAAFTTIISVDTKVSTWMRFIFGQSSETQQNFSLGLTLLPINVAWRVAANVSPEIRSKMYVVAFWLMLSVVLACLALAVQTNYRNASMDRSNNFVADAIASIIELALRHNTKIQVSDRVEGYKLPELTGEGRALLEKNLVRHKAILRSASI